MFILCDEQRGHLRQGARCLEGPLHRDRLGPFIKEGSSSGQKPLDVAL